MSDQLMHDTGPFGGQPCSRCGVKYSTKTCYLPCFVQGDTLKTWVARHVDQLLGLEGEIASILYEMALDARNTEKSTPRWDNPDSPERVEARKDQEDPVVMYLIVRESLNMGPGKIGAQCGHAVGMLDRHYFHTKTSTGDVAIMNAMDKKTRDEMAMFELWDKTSFRKIVLGADDKEWEKVKALGLHFVIVRDAGLTEVTPGSETVIGFWPMLKSEAPKVIRRLQTLK